MSMSAYHEHPAVNRSTLWTIHTEGPFAYKWNRDQGERKVTDSMNLGTAIHAAILEPPEEFTSLVAVYDGTRRGKDWEAFRDKHEGLGMVILTATQYKRVNVIREFIDRHPNVRDLFKTGEPEVSLFWNDQGTGWPCKSRPDWLDVSGKQIIDVKTTSDISDRGLSRSVRQFGAHLQASMALQACAALDYPIEDYYLLFVSTVGAPAIKLRRMPISAIDDGYTIFRDAMSVYVECSTSDSWPIPTLEPNELNWNE